ncbi:protein MOTHER of FT and TFL1-like [Telopea speciosissima]|uniref:protein MOTHER of FT and TFL1-like n=1 Tax=Telopea speciosissima TaxID=54955 RepID=UPI001CC65052|nr:protein MOTHER of FT and TFL1-like [Telopea speciosissima]
MSSSVESLVISRVIGDVIDMFAPSVSMSVKYGSKNVTNGCVIKPSMAMNPPNMVITGHHDDLFTLMMTDPDAPSPSEPSMCELVHWIVKGVLNEVEQPKTCNNFSTRAFANKLELGVPVATVYFNARKEPAHKRR